MSRVARPDGFENLSVNPPGPTKRRHSPECLPQREISFPLAILMSLALPVNRPSPGAT